MTRNRTVAQIEGAKILIHWDSGGAYAIVGTLEESGHVVSQHATREDTHREWVRLDKQHWIVPRTQAAYDEFVAAYPDAVASPAAATIQNIFCNVRT